MYRSFLVSWTQFVANRPRQVLLVVLGLTVVALFIAVTRFSINSDTGKLIRQDTPWRKVHDQYTKSFPQYINNTFVVVSGRKQAAVSNVSKALEIELARETDTFELVYGPANDEYLVRHAMLFM